MSLVDESPELSLRQRERLGGVDLLDDGKFCRREGRQREAAAARTDGHPLTLSTQRDTHAVRQRAEDVHELATGYGDIARLLEAHLRGCNQLDFQVRP